MSVIPSGNTVHALSRKISFANGLHQSGEQVFQRSFSTSLPFSRFGSGTGAPLLHQLGKVG